MITGELKAKVDAIWNSMWTGGLSNPQTVMEQLTLLLFLKGLDDAQTLAERQARARGTALERDLFPDQLDGIAILDDEGKKVAEGRSCADLRWPRFVALPAAKMQEAAQNHLIPFLRCLGSDGAPLRKHMASARYEIPTGRLLSKVVDLIADLPSARAHSHVGRAWLNAHPLRPPRAGQTRPSGQRRSARYRAQASSSGNRASNSWRDMGRSDNQRVGIGEH